MTNPWPWGLWCPVGTRVQFKEDWTYSLQQGFVTAGQTEENPFQLPVWSQSDIKCLIFLLLYEILELIRLTVAAAVLLMCAKYIWSTLSTTYYCYENDVHSILNSRTWLKIKNSKNKTRSFFKNICLIKISLKHYKLLKIEIQWMVEWIRRGSIRGVWPSVGRWWTPVNSELFLEA